jgi:hypothetical protein
MLDSMIETTDDAQIRERLREHKVETERQSDRLRERLEAGLRGLPGVTLWSRAAHRTPTLLLTFAGRDAVPLLTAVICKLLRRRTRRTGHRPGTDRHLRGLCWRRTGGRPES